MIDDVITLWPWFVAAIGVGAATAAFIGAGPRRRLPARWLAWFSAAAAAGALAAALGAVQGEALRVVAVGVACFIAFLVGASTVAVMRGALGAHERWALGLVPLALLWCAAVVNWPHGGDATTIVPPVTGKLEPPSPGKPADAKDTDTTGAISAPATASTNPAAVLAALPAGDLDAPNCQRALEAVATAEPVLFNPKRATVHRRASSALDMAAAMIRRCPQAAIDVFGFDDDPGMNATLALRRARAAERYLRAEGVGGRKLTARAADSRAPRPGRGLIGYMAR